MPAARSKAAPVAKPASPACSAGNRPALIRMKRFFDLIIA